MVLDELRRALTRVWAVLTGRQHDAELDGELASHLAMAEADLLARGASAEQVRRQARLRLGSLDAAREAHRDARGYRHVDSLLQDVRFAARTLRRDPIFASVAILILAIALASLRRR
jgi:putative ABC transport system permease protein